MAAFLFSGAYAVIASVFLAAMLHINVRDSRQASFWTIAFLAGIWPLIPIMIATLGALRRRDGK